MTKAQLVDRLGETLARLDAMTDTKNKAVAGLRLWRSRAGDLTLAQIGEYDDLIDELEAI